MIKNDSTLRRNLLVLYVDDESKNIIFVTSTHLYDILKDLSANYNFLH